MSNDQIEIETPATLADANEVRRDRKRARNRRYRQRRRDDEVCVTVVLPLTDVELLLIDLGLLPLDAADSPEAFREAFGAFVRRAIKDAAAAESETRPAAPRRDAA